MSAGDAMRIAIMGAGAMGSMFGGMLKKAGADVWLVDGWREHMDKIRADGLLMSTGDGDELVELNATTDPGEPGTMDVVVLLTKTNLLEQSTRDALPMIDDQTIVLGLQNGLGHDETIAAVIPEDQVLFGFCEIGADLLGPGHIQIHLGDGSIKFKPVNGVVQDKHQDLANMFGLGGINATIEDDIETAIWNKLSINVCFNATCALTRLHAGDMAAHPASPVLLESILEEIISVAQAKGVQLDSNALLAKMKKLGAAAGTHYPSLAQDVKNKRSTEIMALNGAVAREAEKVGVSAPVNATIASLIAILQDTYEKQF